MMWKNPRGLEMKSLTLAETVSLTQVPYYSSFLVSVLPYSDPFSIFVSAIILYRPMYAARKTWMYLYAQQIKHENQNKLYNSQAI